MISSSDIVKLSKQLYPTGRAFRMFSESNLEAYYTARGTVFAQAFNDAANIQDAILPDNDNFTESDAEFWERVLGMIDGAGVPLADRKAAITRKMQAPGVNPAKAHYLYIEQQLQLAGFNVYVHENLIALYPSGYYSEDPVYSLPQVNFAQLGDDQMGDFQLGDVRTFYTAYITEAQLNNFQLGDMQMDGYTWTQKVANGITNTEDRAFNLGENFRCTFFIGGPTLGTFANVPAVRELEFRQTILRLKPVPNIAILLINYT